MKQYCLTFLKRGLLAASGVPLILAMIYGILGVCRCSPLRQFTPERCIWIIC